jgi:hypothetical protein
MLLISAPNISGYYVWRRLRDVAIVWLTKLFNLIFWLNKMLDEWRCSILVLIFKNKGSYTNYRRIKLISHTMSLWERIIEHRLMGVTNVTENQFGFIPGWSTIEVIFLIRQLMVNYRNKRKTGIWSSLTLRRPMIKWLGMPCGGPCKSTKYIILIKAMYYNVVTSVRTSDRDTYDFSINIGLYQGSALSPYRFAWWWMRSQETYKVIFLGACLSVSCRPGTPAYKI